MIRSLGIAVLALFPSGTAAVQDTALRATLLTGPPEVAGVLVDAAWTQVAGMPNEGWAAYNPDLGDKSPEAYRAEVRVVYDDRTIYFAFHCFDNELDKI